MSKPTSIKIKDADLLEKAVEVAIAKNIIPKKNYASFIEILLNDFLNNQALSDMNRLNIVTSITEVLSNELQLFEERMSNRALKYISELSIQLSIANQMLYEFTTKYDDKNIAEEKYQQFRKKAIDHLRETKFIIKNTDFYND